MKARGVTDQQIGYLIAIGFVSGAFFSVFSGAITDFLGRKRTTLIFDLIAWPFSLMIYFFATQFWHFVLASVFNNVARIVNVSSTLMMVEDANDEERKAAFTISNIIGILSGTFVPLAGVLVDRLGIIPAERILLLLATISMTVMFFGRNYYYVETRIGQEILRAAQEKKQFIGFRLNLFGNTFSYLKQRPAVLVGMMLVILFNVYLPIGTINSMYFVPYLTEKLDLNEALVSLLGVVNAVTMLLVLVILLPRLHHMLFPLLLGLVFQLVSQAFLLWSPPGRFWPVVVAIICYSLGFGLFRPLVDTLFADITEGKERAGLYGLNNTLTSVLSALAGFYSGQLYEAAPVNIYIFSFVILLLCVAALFLYAFMEKKTVLPKINLPWRKDSFSPPRIKM
ncbi:MAG TPA: MFS transporter [Firmicutes bacterium]|nr:MFS transporter [Bacillota bacterium]